MRTPAPCPGRAARRNGARGQGPRRVERETVKADWGCLLSLVYFVFRLPVTLRSQPVFRGDGQVAEL